MVVLSAAEITDVASAIAMEDRHALEPDTLRRLLASASPEVRRRAVLAAGRIGDRRAEPLLLAALGDGAAAVRADAAFALGLLKDTSAMVVRGLAELALPGPAPGATEPAAPSGPRGAAPGPAPATPAARAVTALGWIGGSGAFEAVAGVLSRAATAQPGARGPAGAGPTPRPDSVLHAALLAAWRFGPRPRALALVLPFTRAARADTRWRAVYALMRLGGPAAAPALLAAMRDPDALVRSFAARGLRAALADSAGLRRAAEVALRAAVADPDAGVRTNAIRALGSYHDPALVPLLAPLLAGADDNLAITAAETLGSLSAPAAAVPLEAVVGRDSPRLALRGAALASLVRLDPARGVARAAQLAGAADWRARLYAARALAGGRWSGEASLVRELAEDADPRVAAAALESAVALVGDTIDAAYTLFLQEVGAPDPIVRANALKGLERRARPGDLGVLLDAYARARADTLDDAALAAIDALGALARDGVPVARSFYLRFPASPDPLVRREAQHELGAGSWPPAWPAAAGRTAADYETLVRRYIVPALQGAPDPAVRIRTAGGEIVLALAGSEAPRTTDNFLRLVRRRYFDGARWHRVVANFVIQDGDPRGDGNGGPGYSIRDEMNPLPYDRGALGMALAGPDTGGSQFFITHSPQPHLDGGYTVFGHVTAGMDVVDRVVQGDGIQAIEAIQ